MRSCIFQFCFTIKSEFCEINILISIMCNDIFLNQKWKDNKNFKIIFNRKLRQLLSVYCLSSRQLLIDI
jgi:hypothetical protein